MKKDHVRGDHNVFQAGSMQVKFIQNNFPHLRGDWHQFDDDDDFTEFEEIKESFKKRKEEPNYFQTGRFLKRILNEDWFDELRTHQRYTHKWREAMVDALLESEWKDTVAEAWEDKGKRETLKCYIVGALKDAGVIKGKYDAIAKRMGYEEDYRTYSRYLGRGKQQPYYDWIYDYVNGQE